MKNKIVDKAALYYKSTFFKDVLIMAIQNFLLQFMA